MAAPAWHSRAAPVPACPRALPMSSTSPSVGIEVAQLRDLWLPITIQVAWTLLRRGYTPSEALLGDAREHVLRCLPSHCTTEVAEWLAAQWTHDYLARRLDGAYRPGPLPGPETRIPATAWRARLLEANDDRASLAVFRFHYAELLELPKAARRLRCRTETLADGRARLRNRIARFIDQHPQYDGERDDRAIDHILRRLAVLPEPGGPGPLGLMSPAGLAHAERCPRTSRAVRLLRQRHLDTPALFPPTQSPASGKTSVIALLVHHEARRHSAVIARVVGPNGTAAGPGLWLLPTSEEGRLYDALTEVCARGRPARHHVRAARVRGSGRWSGTTLLGPVAVRAIDRARAVPWGDICGRPPLPMPAPPLPTAHSWWAAAIAVAAATILLGVRMATPTPPTPPTPIEARFHTATDGWRVSFDLPDHAVLDVVAVQGQSVQVLHRDMRAARGAWSTGHGDFQAHIPADQIALIASPRGVADLERLALESAASPDPLGHLELLLSTHAPKADFARSRVPVVAQASGSPPPQL